MTQTGSALLVYFHSLADGVGHKVGHRFNQTRKRISGRLRSPLGHSANPRSLGFILADAF